MSTRDEASNGVLAKRLKAAFLIFALIAAFFLLTEHRAHLMTLLPWLLLAACPLMHLFMHHGKHGHHGRDAQGERDHG